MEKRQYYKKFRYRIEKKLSVQDNKKLKDYAKQSIYIYIIHEETDNNRFIFISSKHFEEKTIIEPESFKIKSANVLGESIHLKKSISRFGIYFYRILQEKGEITISLKDLIFVKRKDGTPFKKYLVHEKAVALDNPDWYLELLKEIPCRSYKKKLIKELLCKDKSKREI